MKFFGIPTRAPSFSEVTAASVMALGTWLCTLALLLRLDHPLSAYDAGALLVVMTWGCIGARLGIRLDRGGRHIVASLAVSSMLLGFYAGAWAIMA